VRSDTWNRLLSVPDLPVTFYCARHEKRLGARHTRQCILRWLLLRRIRPFSLGTTYFDRGQRSRRNDGRTGARAAGDVDRYSKDLRRSTCLQGLHSGLACSATASTAPLPAPSGSSFTAIAK
jgi:hypothetical protein